MTTRKKRIIILVLVLLSAAIVHGRCLMLGFNSFWDLLHVFRNPFQSPISLELAGKAFTVIVEAEYTPLRLLTNSIDYTFWNLNPFGHHLSSYLFFLINLLLVYLLLERLMALAGRPPAERITGAGLTAFLFGIHPLRVEVVSWITPREYSICSCFYLLSVILYLKWVAKRSIKWFWFSFAAAIGAGLSQPFSVSLPAVLLLLDYYPLKRFSKKNWKRLFLEKIPFLLIAIFVTVKIIRIRRQVQIIHPAGPEALLRNFIEFPAVIVSYLHKTIFPLALAPIYPMDYTARTPLIVFSAILTVAAIVYLLVRRKKYPALFAGALFLIVMLLPAGGLMRSGATVLADRYLQIANIPMLFGLSWLIMQAWRRRRLRWVTISIVALWSAFLIWKTFIYTALWDRPVELTRLAYQRWPGSKIIEIFMLRTYNNSALNLIDQGKMEEALEYIRRALEIKPDYVDAYLVRAHVLALQGKDDEALRVYQKALQIKRDYGNTYLNRGVLLARRGELEAAEDEFRRAIVYGEDSAEAHYNLGLIHKIQGELDRAETEFKQALVLNRFSPEIYGQLAEVLSRRGRSGEAVELYREAVRNSPKSPAYRLALGFACLQAGSYAEAEAAFRAAIELDENLGAAYAGLASCSFLRGERKEASRLRDEALRRGYEDIPSYLRELK